MLLLTVTVVTFMVNIEENGQLQHDVYYKLDQSYRDFEIVKCVLYKKLLLFCYCGGQDLQLHTYRSLGPQRYRIGKHLRLF